MGSHFNGDKRNITMNCEYHGTYELDQEFIILKSLSFWSPSDKCKSCEEVEKEEKQNAERVRQQEAMLRESIARTLVPLRFVEKTFDNFEIDCDKSRNAFTICKSYAEKFENLREQGTCLIMCGNTGTGKTHLACAISDYITRNITIMGKLNIDDNPQKYRARVIFMETIKVIRAIKQTYSKGSSRTEQQVINSFVQPDLLILDEVGIQFGSDTERMIIFEVINERYLNMKPTILISNLALKELSEFIGDRVIDRMRENGGKIITFDWKTHRSN